MEMCMTKLNQNENLESVISMKDVNKLNLLAY
jgi:hypothetical protein